MFGVYFDNVRKSAPLIHNITNYVTANDVANVLLACGGSPIMSDEPEDAAQITALCRGLHLNLGTLRKSRIESMLKAGKKSRELRHVILLDPVGAGASILRTETALRIMAEIKPDVIRGNVSEMKVLALEMESALRHSSKKCTDGSFDPSYDFRKETEVCRGVDAAVSDRITNENLENAVTFVKNLSGRTGSIIAVTGAIDLVGNANTCYIIWNGRPEMSRITGTGCQLSGMMTAFLAANPDQKLEAAAAAVCAMGLAGEIGWKHMRTGDGNATYRNRIIDALYNMDGHTLDQGARYEIRE